MAVIVPNPYTGKDEETCSVSFAAQQQMGAHTTGSPQTEAEYNKSKQLGEWGVIYAKLLKKEIPEGTKLVTYSNPTNGNRGFFYTKNGQVWQRNYNAQGKSFDAKATPEQVQTYLKSKYFDTAIPRSVSGKADPKAAEEALLASLSKAQRQSYEVILKEGPIPGGYTYKHVYQNSLPSLYKMGLIKSTKVNEFESEISAVPLHEVVKVAKPQADTKSPIAAPSPSSAVNAGSDSVGSMSHEDVAAMFVKIKDDLAKEQGLNIKGANPELDQLVYGKIGEATGYTGAEVKAKIDAYKADGNKLSALKKKVLTGTKKVPEGKPQPTKATPAAPLNVGQHTNKPAQDPQPNGVPTVATPKLAEGIKKAIALDEKLDDLYSDEDVASAYIIAKDKIVAESDGTWTLYTKSSAMDHAIYSEIYDKTGLSEHIIKKSIADYLASGKKLSALKKQLAKQGTFTPQADTLKKSGAAKDQESKNKDVDTKADAGYTPTPTPAVAGKTVPLVKPVLADYKNNGGVAAWKKDLDAWEIAGGKTSPPKIDTGKPAPKAVQREAEQAGSIDHITDANQLAVYQAFKAKGSLSYLSSTNQQTYDALVEVQSTFGANGQHYTLLQLLRVIDEQGAKKFQAENGKLFEKKVASWLTSPEGTAHIKAREAKLVRLAEQAKAKVEAEKLAKELEANQPPLPADSALFQEMTPSKAQRFQDDMLAKKPFGPGEKAGLRHYTGGAYTAMNGYLRGVPNYRNITGADKNHIEPAIRGFRPAPEPMLLRRGTGASQFISLGVDRGQANLLWGLTGKTFEDKGFLSTSAAGRAAFGGEVNLEIETPAGTPCMWVDNFSKHPGENEMMLRPGLQYKVLNVRKEGGTFVVRLRVVNWPGKE